MDHEVILNSRDKKTDLDNDLPHGDCCPCLG